MKEHTQEKFTVFNQNGESFGPVDLITLIAWAKDGRLQAPNKIVSDLNGKVYRVEDFPELKSIVAGLPPVVQNAVQNVGQSHTISQSSDSNGVPVINIINNNQSNNSGSYAQFTQQYTPKSKVVAGLLGIFLGYFGIHRFYLGYTGIGTLMLCLSLILPFVTCGLYLYCPFVIIWGFIEGILILCGQFRDASGMELQD